MWGAAGGLGSLTVKLAVAQGISVVALDQAEGLRAYAIASLGARHYVATQGKSSAALAAEVARACGGRLRGRAPAMSSTFREAGARTTRARCARRRGWRTGHPQSRSSCPPPPPAR